MTRNANRVTSLNKNITAASKDETLEEFKKARVQPDLYDNHMVKT